MFKNRIQIKLIGKISNETANLIATMLASATLIIALSVLLGTFILLNS